MFLFPVNKKAAPLAVTWISPSKYSSVVFFEKTPCDTSFKYVSVANFLRLSYTCLRNSFSRTCNWLHISVCVYDLVGLESNSLRIRNVNPSLLFVFLGFLFRDILYCIYS